MLHFNSYMPKKSGIAALCASTDNAQVNLVQADPEQQLQKRKKCNLPFEVTDWKLFTCKNYIAMLAQVA